MRTPTAPHPVEDGPVHPAPFSAAAPPRRQPRWTPLIGLGLKARVARRARSLSDTAWWTANAAAMQTAQLRRLLRTARGTEFGRAHGFARLAALPAGEVVSAYRAAAPVAEYSAFRELVARMREGGERDVLWPGLVEDFAQTSGTTAGDKYTPVSRAMLRSNFLASLDIFAHATRFGLSLPRLAAGRFLFLGGSTDLTTNGHGVRTGDLSGIVTPLIRWPLTEVYSPGREIALMAHWPSKIDAMARAALDQDVRMVCGMPSWGLVLFERVLELARERAGGGAAGKGIRGLMDVWPNLELFVHGGVKYAPFAPRVRGVYSGSADGPDIPNRLELYPSSEGFVAIQDVKSDPGLRLLTDVGNFYEFVPLEEIDHASPAAFTCDAVEKGQRYVVVMTTCAGLWRYVIGDVVEFDTIPASPGGGRSGDGPPRLRIVGRHRHFINAFGENLIVEHVENAVAAAAAESGLAVGEFTAAPVYPRDGGHGGLELAIEVRGGGGGGEAAVTVHPRALEVFRDAFDGALKRQNVDYTTKRTDGLGMGAPTITPLPAGTFHRWLASRGKLGGQHKCPRCANGREILDAVVAAGR